MDNRFSRRVLTALTALASFAVHAEETPAEAAKKLHLYSDPTCRALHEAFAASVGVSPDCVLATNGSDEILNFAFMAFCDSDNPAYFPDITYGFYPVFADFFGIELDTIPLKSDLSIGLDDYYKSELYKNTYFIKKD